MICVILKSVSEQNIISIEQFLQDLLSSKGENCTYFKLYYVFDDRSEI